MRNPIKKASKWVRRNPTLTGVIILSVLVLVWVVYLWRKRAEVITTTAKTVTGSKYRIPAAKRTFDVTKVYKMMMLTDAENWTNRMNVISAAGFDTVMLVVPIGETYTAGFDKYIEYANVAVNLGLNVVLKPWIIFLGKDLNADFTENEMQTNSSGNRLFGSRYHLSLSSSKWSKVYDWINRFKTAFQPFYDAGYVIACFPANHSTGEFGYQLACFGDFSNPETIASNNLNRIGTNTLDYHRFQTLNLKNKLAGIASILSGWRVGFEAGSFYYGFHKFAATFNYDEISNIPNVVWLKNNPIINTSKDFDAALQYDWKQRHSGYYCTEWTNADGATAESLAIHHRNTINQGGNLCSFAFHVPDANGGGAAWNMAKQVRQILIDSGDWNKPVQSPARNGLLSYSLERIFNENGYDAIKAQFEGMINGGVLPNVRCTG
ncbi:MAG: hypothetical protein U0X91_30800 [Spirosomataceae bacterium]